MEAQFGLDVPGNPYVDYSVDLQAALGQLRDGGSAASAAEMMSGYTVKDDPNSPELFLDMQSKVSAFASGKALEDGTKPTISQVRDSIKALMAAEKANREKIQAAAAGSAATAPVPTEPVPAAEAN